jgi:hypothetical protein
MSAENLQILRNRLASFWTRHPYSAISGLVVELARLADADLSNRELRAAEEALTAAGRVSSAIAPLLEAHPATRADEQREFCFAMLKLIASAAGRKIFAEMLDAVKERHAERIAALEAAARARRLEEQMRREAQWRAEAAAMSIEQIISEIENAGYALDVRDGKLLAPKSFPLIHRFRVELRRNEVIEFLRRRAEQAAATEEV